MDNVIYELENYKIEQREDGFFNATWFLEQWNALNKVKKRIDVFMRTSEALDAIVECRVSKEESIDKVREPFTKGRPKETIWLNPKLLVPLVNWLDSKLGTKAMYITAAILITVIKKDYIAERTLKLKTLVSNFDGDYNRVEKGINCVLDKETDNYLERIIKKDDIISRIIGEIEINIIKDYDSLINRLGDMYKSRK